MRRGHTGRGGIEELVVTSPAGKQENVSAGGSGFEEVLESNQLLPGSVYQSVCLIISVYTEGNGNTATGHSRACEYQEWMRTLLQKSKKITFGNFKHCFIF